MIIQLIYSILFTSLESTSFRAHEQKNPKPSLGLKKTFFITPIVILAALSGLYFALFFLIVIDDYSNTTSEFPNLVSFFSWFYFFFIFNIYYYNAYNSLSSFK